MYTGDNMSLLVMHESPGAMFLGKGFFVASHESKTEPSLGTANDTAHKPEVQRCVCVCLLTLFVRRFCGPQAPSQRV